MGASRTTDLLEFYSEFGPRIGLEKMARAGVDISSDSVSVITSALTIRNIDPSSGHFVLVVNFGYSWGRYFG